MTKISETNLDKQYVAFAIIDWENFLEAAHTNNIISTEEYEKMKKDVEKIAQRCELKGEWINMLEFSSEKQAKGTDYSFCYYCNYHYGDNECNNCTYFLEGGE